MINSAEISRRLAKKGIRITPRSVERFVAREARTSRYAQMILDTADEIIREQCDASRQMVETLRVETVGVDPRGGFRERT
jgi:hypothetical protein